MGIPRTGTLVTTPLAAMGTMAPMGFHVAVDKVHTAAVCHTMAPEARWGPIPVRQVHTTALAEAPELFKSCPFLRGFKSTPDSPYRSNSPSRMNTVLSSSFRGLKIFFKLATCRVSIAPPRVVIHTARDQPSWLY